ncbi:LacI family transcriptional regulator [Cryobacterium lactosi]|uniref:LacI family transcriptional regulator n=1 Tax=Cryobacterium lactosi TaxID=1259202 RepID=A0A4R9BTJ7_9MICO|nr:LacI family DNA-binding transcriptional regulator [Cryobacterium lactosi]TFD90627.1 LacI family transcriptional regulator [Cryobacterium lactosi]
MAASPTASPATLHDVAREAGVSLATASRSLNGSTRKVNDEYRQRVLAAAARLNYSPNFSAQAVAKGSTSTVALLVSDIADPYFSSIAAGVIRAAETQGLIVTMAVTERSTERELELVRALRGQRPRVMILTGSRSDGSESQAALVAELKAFAATGGRVVLISQEGLPFSTVVVDNYLGARALANSLVGQGYRRFAAIGGARTLVTSRDRLAGFADGLAEHGIAIHPDHIVRGEFTRDGGFAAATELLADGIGQIDLVFAVSDVMAIGAMSAFREAGIVVPRDIAVAGFDDIDTARDVTPALTTVHIPLADLGQQAVELALSDAALSSDEVIRVETRVVLRASSPQL